MKQYYLRFFNHHKKEEFAFAINETEFATFEDTFKNDPAPFARVDSISNVNIFTPIAFFAKANDGWMKLSHHAYESYRQGI